MRNDNGLGRVIGAAAASLFFSIPLGLVIFLIWGLLSIEFFEYEYFGYTWTNFWACMLWPIVVLAVVMGGAEWIKLSGENVRRLEGEQEQARREQEELRLKRQGLLRAAEADASAAVRSYESLPVLLKEAADWREKARTHFQVGAYSPFWAAIENAFVRLGEYNATIQTLQRLAGSYAQNAKSHREMGGDKPVVAFPVTLSAAEATDAAEPIAASLRVLAYEAQRDPVYSQIWEQRRTTAAVVQGFRSLESAVDRLDQVVQQSAAELSGKIGTLQSVVGGVGNAVTGSVAAASAREHADLAGMNAAIDKAVWLLDDERKRALGWR